MIFRSASRTVWNVRLGLVVLTALALAAGVASASGGGFRPGAPGAGDPYFPLDGNGGYDVKHYRSTSPTTRRRTSSTGVATIEAARDAGPVQLQPRPRRARRSIGQGQRRPGAVDASGAELTDQPAKGLRERQAFTDRGALRRDPGDDRSTGSASGLHPHRRRRARRRPAARRRHLVPGQRPPEGQGRRTPSASPSPRGSRRSPTECSRTRRTKRGRTTWTWAREEPMASYLATATIGEFDLRRLQATDGIELLGRPRSGSVRRPWPRRAPASSSPSRSGRAVVQAADPHDQRPGRRRRAVVLDRPATPSRTGTSSSSRRTRRARTTGRRCPTERAHEPEHRVRLPVLARRCTRSSSTTRPTTATVRARPRNDRRLVGGERRERRRRAVAVDLSAYAGGDVEVSISYASDDSVQLPGVFVDDIVVSTGAGTTSFEADGDTFDGWTVPGAPAGSAPQRQRLDRRHRGRPPAAARSTIAEGSFARQAEILDFLSENLRRRTRSSRPAGSSTTCRLGFALENQTRPIYANRLLHRSARRATRVVVHELAHQWFGDSLAVAAWQHIWLNEGFATYAEWLWSRARRASRTVAGDLRLLLRRHPGRTIRSGR